MGKAIASLKIPIEVSSPTQRAMDTTKLVQSGNRGHRSSGTTARAWRRYGGAGGVVTEAPQMPSGTNVLVVTHQPTVRCFPGPGSECRGWWRWCSACARAGGPNCDGGLASLKAGVETSLDAASWSACAIISAIIDVAGGCLPQPRSVVSMVVARRLSGRGSTLGHLGHLHAEGCTGAVLLATSGDRELNPPGRHRAADLAGLEAVAVGEIHNGRRGHLVAHHQDLFPPGTRLTCHRQSVRDRREAQVHGRATELQRVILGERNLGRPGMLEKWIARHELREGLDREHLRARRR